MHLRLGTLRTQEHSASDAWRRRLLCELRFRSVLHTGAFPLHISYLRRTPRVGAAAHHVRGAPFMGHGGQDEADTPVGHQPGTRTQLAGHDPNLPRRPRSVGGGQGQPSNHIARIAFGLFATHAWRRTHHHDGLTACLGVGELEAFYRLDDFALLLAALRWPGCQPVEAGCW